jgi:hypothetical protein
MTTAQVKARVPQVKFGRTDDFGVSKTTINPDFDPRFDKASLSGVRTISLDFVDGRLTSLWLGYDGTFKWHTVPDFVKGISQSLHLPDAWRPWRTRGQQLSCTDFRMTLSIVSEGPSFHITDDTAEQTVAARITANAEADAADPGESLEIMADNKTMIYYLGNCRPAIQIKEENCVTFRTRAEAEQAGYKLAKNCE